MVNKSKAYMRQKAKLKKYFERDELYGDIIQAKELEKINKKVAANIAKKRAGRRGRK